LKVKALAKVKLDGQKEITRELGVEHGACFSLYRRSSILK
jgi:hypothetical protein